MVTYPKEQMLAYWKKMAPHVLLFLKGRHVSVEQVFGNVPVYRRYEDREQKHLIAITTEKDINTWAYQYTYAFHPYICDKKEQRCWFVLDVDPKDEKTTLPLVKEITAQAAAWFTDHKYAFLLKFCGKNGFHCIWEWSGLHGDKAYAKSQEIIMQLVEYLYQKGAAKQVVLLPTDQAHKKLIQDTWQTEMKGKPMLYFDSKILHDFGNIRSPFSLHPITGLVSYPLLVEQLKSFRLTMATPQKVMKQDWGWVKLPVNRIR